jgi:Tfp pilus assembly protein PilF
MFRLLRNLTRFFTRQLPELVLRVVMAPAHFGTWFFGGIWRLFMSWWESRRLRHLLYGMPALIVFGISGYFAAAATFRTRSSISDRYFAAGRRAFESRSFETAKLYLERVVELQPNDNEALWMVQQAAKETKDNNRYGAILAKLAPEEGGGRPDSHLELAMTILNSGTLTPDDVDRAKKHLNYTVNRTTNDASMSKAQALLGDIAFGRGEHSIAIEHYEQAVSIRPELALQLSKAYRFGKNPEDKKSAERWGAAARDFWSKQSDLKPQDVEIRLTAAESDRWLEQFEQAEARLRGGLPAKTPEEESRIRQMLAQTYLNWAESLTTASAAENQSVRFDLVSRAILAYPHNAEVFQSMMLLLKSGDDVAGKAKDFLLDNISQGRAIGMSHLLLGTQALVDLDDAQAEIHLKRAMELMPQTAIVANNFAWYLAFKDPPELDKALTLIDPIVQLAPNEARILDTRGNILVKLKRYEEGVNDLEKALRTLKNDPQTHAALAEGYEAMGIPDLAERHRKEAERLKKP